ncbi:hypothetical protein CTAYLR_007867 [Chrysophaeum taylorii]|uniref:CN hydrolase domain-containing protein n=1 Tax=Chrysophaeum taylorii TaxID=2483200 RepID=A0AAD7XI22_9STRA|nr:hypothetical protein CTAYLR_007867 [Chrysophaeum taylorii]
MSSGLGGLNKSPNGVVIGLVQLQLPSSVKTKAELRARTQRVVEMVGKAKRNMPTIDLVVFPEYSLHGLSMDTSDEILCDRNGPETAALAAACKTHKLWGCFSIMERNPGKMPFNSGLIYNDEGVEVLYYRKLHPWVPVEPWEPGDVGIPVVDGPNGCRLALIICHDGAFAECAREAAYKGAEIMLRTAGYTAPIRNAWKFTNQANAFQNLMVTASVCMSGTDGTFDSMGEGMFCNFDGEILVSGSGRPDEIITCEVRPDLVREARVHWGVENNIYQFGHHGYVAVQGGATDCPYTFMKDLVKGEWNLPWDVKHKDGTSCGFAPPTRIYENGRSV